MCSLNVLQLLPVDLEALLQRLLQLRRVAGEAVDLGDGELVGDGLGEQVLVLGGPVGDDARVLEALVGEHEPGADGGHVLGLVLHRDPRVVHVAGIDPLSVVVV